MELKTRYQYSYFIHPYIIEQDKYTNYMYKLLKDKNCKLRIFEKEKDLSIYTYFLPNVRNYMFNTFNSNSESKNAFEQLDLKVQASILTKNPCTVFEYDLGGDVQGKIGEENGIFFEISKIEIMCFNTGICFILLKTNLEEENNFSNLLNFNYKFRDINSEFISLKDYENIRLQTSSFKDIRELKVLINNITGGNNGAKELNLEDERFLTYSYVCIDQEHWNETNTFETIENEFIKFINVLPNSNSTSFDGSTSKNNYLNLEKYAKVGVTKQGAFLFTTSVNLNNYTNLLFSFEKEMLYTYILSIYKKIFLKKISNQFVNDQKSILEVKKSFINFTQDIWQQDITSNVEGSLVCDIFNRVLELDMIYNQVKDKYDLYYKDINLNKAKKTNIIIGIILIVTFIFNIVNFIILLKDK